MGSSHGIPRQTCLEFVPHNCNSLGQNEVGLPNGYRHPRESGGLRGQPLWPCSPWIPAFAGTTNRSDDPLRIFASFLVSFSKRMYCTCFHASYSDGGSPCLRGEFSIKVGALKCRRC